ncbi:7tm 1 and/or 7TM GPCR Srsx domain containing protein [Asbolus verrucosus]|uniref:7tm 1 and/or 7TM GPCR Srsx domain containing protein n=1 Tax=Asbolus verrucosus TaxID=1661398 RepID=A0A482VZU4_ASBVE|nr:7tm 1 and/or 7TM GPCR Srsx domain containing protein [Asbolus verrucosus]
MDAVNASIFNNATKNSTDTLLNQSAEHFMLLFEDIDQYFNHLNLSNDSDYSTYDRQILNCTLNATNASCVVHQEEPHITKNYWALVLVLFPIFTLFGNVLVILSVYRERTLQSATNYFIVSLALADLLVAVVVMPFAVYVLI